MQFSDFPSLGGCRTTQNMKPGKPYFIPRLVLIFKVEERVFIYLNLVVEAESQEDSFAGPPSFC